MSHKKKPRRQFRPLGRGMVQVLDPRTGVVTTIPADELGPEMVRVRVTGLAGVEGPVWMDPRNIRIRKAPLRHPPFDAETRERLRRIKAAVDEMYPITLGEWEDGFRGDLHPQREIALWTHVAAIYTELTSQAGMNLDRKREVYGLLLRCTSSTADQVLSLAHPEFLSPEEVQEVVTRYFEGNKVPIVPLTLYRG